MLRFLRHIENLRTEVFDCRKDLAALHNAKKIESFYREAVILGEESGSEILNGSRKQAFCRKLEQLVTKLDSSHAAIIQIAKSKFAKYWLTTLNNSKYCFQDLPKTSQQTAESGNQTSLVSSTSVGDEDPNETVVGTRNGALENAKENTEVSSKHSATHGNRKQPIIRNSRPSRRRHIEEMELENLKAKNETEQRLRERQLELEEEREEIELRPQQEELHLQQEQQQQQREQELQQQQQEQELRLKMQQKEDEMRLRQHQQALENESKKAEEEEEQRRMKLELAKGSSRASGSVAD